MASAAIDKILPIITSPTILKVGASVAALVGAGALVSPGVSNSKTSSILVVKPLVTNLPGTTPKPIASPASTPAVPAKPSFQLGVNLGTVAYWGGDRIFANLLTGANWMDPAKGWGEVSDADQDANGNMLPAAMPAGREVLRILTPTAEVLTGKGATIRCTWEGTGTISFGGNRGGGAAGDHSYEVFFSPNKPSDARIWLSLRDMSAKDPVRNLDCREKGMARSELFSPEFIDSLKPYGVLRFLDWSAVNANPQSVKWADRTLPGSIYQARPQGPALEHIVALSNKLSADPWVNVPWNADDDYITRMAQLMHDGIPANRRVYVELSNEVWNYMFNVSRQSEREGLARNLSENGFIANLRRYSERTGEVMRIWSKVFADRPGQLVRVAATQHDNPWTAEMVLGAPGLADNIDALATAPYFGHDFFSGSVANMTDTAQMLSILAGYSQKSLADAGEANAALAKKYGKRYIAYEAGQHILEPNGLARISSLNRSNAMYDIYVKFITDWKTRFNDTMVLYSNTSPISGYGAWGLREYTGQPLSETPKLRAAIAMGRK
jgi:hypothetical protein